MLPDRIILVRHAQSEGNVNQATYTYLPDPQVPLVSERKQQQQQQQGWLCGALVGVPWCLFKLQQQQ
jgi:broad specificity phosphatase PhoE